MLAILNSLKDGNFPIFQPILMILVSNFMVHRALSIKTLVIRVAVPFDMISMGLSVKHHGSKGTGFCYCPRCPITHYGISHIERVN